MHAADKNTLNQPSGLLWVALLGDLKPRLINNVKKKLKAATCMKSYHLGPLSHPYKVLTWVSEETF